MSSCDRRSFLALAGLLPLAACGFTPVYGPNGGGGQLWESVAYAEPGNSLGFGFVSRLEDRLGRSSSPSYRLDYSIGAGESSLALDGAVEVSRSSLHGSVTFSLVDLSTGQVVQTGDARTFIGFNVSGSPVTTAAARRSAQDRLVVALADQVVAQLLSEADQRT